MVKEVHVAIDEKEKASTGAETPANARPWLASYPGDVDWYAPFIARPFPKPSRRYAETTMPIGPVSTFSIASFPMPRSTTWPVKSPRDCKILGVRKGAKVGLFLPNCPYSVACFFGILRAGGTVVNYNPLYVTREIEQQVEDSETDIMITLDLKALLPKLEPLVGTSRLKAIVVAKLAPCLPFPKNLLYPLVKRADIAKASERSRLHPLWPARRQ